MRRSLIVLVALVLSLAPCAVAAAQLGPNVPDPLVQEPPPPPPSVNSDAEDDGGLSTLQLVLIFGGAMAVLAFIAWVILRDARRAAPVAEGRAHASSGKPQLSARERERLQRQRRDKAKAARQQRKRNRPH